MQIILTEEEFNTLKKVETNVLARVNEECDRRMKKFYEVMAAELKVREDSGFESFHRRPYILVEELTAAVAKARKEAGV